MKHITVLMNGYQNLDNMNFELLDCTLRDGGYINNWQFNQEKIIKIVTALIDTNVENIELGYLSNKSVNDISTRLDSIKKFDTILNNVDKKNSKFYLMIDFNDYHPSFLPDKSSNNIDVIRLVFHKKDLENIYEQAKIIKEKGYQLFIQPMSTHTYDDNELNKLFDISKSLDADSVYIVDSFGCIDYFQLKEIFLKFYNNLDQNIYIGLHLHDNINTAFSNAINMIKENFERKIIIDTSITGIGRGAGNVKTEFLTLMYQNIKNYNSETILKLIQENDIFNNDNSIKNIAYFLSGINKNHPSKVIKMLEENKSILEIYKYFISC